MIEEGKFKNVEITLLGTFWTVPAGKNVTYVEGQGIITTKEVKIPQHLEDMG